MSYTRQVPKFLQAHAHLLGKGHARQEEEPTLTAEEVKQDAGTDSEDEQVTALLLEGISKCTTKQGLATIPNEGPGSGKLLAHLCRCAGQAALQRALEENPELAGTDQRLQKLADKTAAAQSKELGNDAFKSGRCAPETAWESSSPRTVHHLEQALLSEIVRCCGALKAHQRSSVMLQPEPQHDAGMKLRCSTLTSAYGWTPPMRCSSATVQLPA